MNDRGRALATKRRPTIKHVAERAGVSVATVSHVFSGKKRVNEELAKRVRAAADALGYAVDRAASQLRSGRARAIAVIVPDLEDLFLGRLVSAIEERAEQAGYEVIVLCSRDDPDVEQRRLRSLLAWRPAGIVGVPCIDSFPDDFLHDLGDTPMVAADRIRPGMARFDTVTIDNDRAGIVTIDHLVSKGAKSVVFVASSLEVLTIRRRVEAARGRISSATDVSLNVLEVGRDPEEGANRLAAWLESHPRPEAMVGLTNGMTLAILSAFARVGIAAPKDVLLLGYHDSLWMTARQSPVTTMAQPVDEAATHVWQQLARRMAGYQGPAEDIVLQAELIERASTQGL